MVTTSPGQRSLFARFPSLGEFGNRCVHSGGRVSLLVCNCFTARVLPLRHLLLLGGLVALLVSPLLIAVIQWRRVFIDRRRGRFAIAD